MEELAYGTETNVSAIGLMMEFEPVPSTVLTAAIAGGARLRERLGAAEAARAVDRCVKRIERAVDAFAGRIHRAGGDSVTAIFDTADGAINAALEMHHRVADLPPVSGVKLAVCLGVAGGGDNAPEDDCRAAARLAGQAQPGRLLLEGGLRAQLSSQLAPLLTAVEGDVTATSGAVLEIVVPDSTVSSGAAEGKRPEVIEARVGCLRLGYGQDTLWLNEDKVVLHLGRDSGSDVVIRDRRASRHHAMIERRANAIVLIDKSTNGTFVLMEGQPERFVKHSQCVLQGKGLIAFASPTSDANADFADFEIV